MRPCVDCEHIDCGHIDCEHVDCQTVAPQALNALLDAEAFEMCCRFDECVASSGLEESLLHLVKVRASQISGCASCIDRYTSEARSAGETERRLYVLGAWRRASSFTPRERAALAWAEAVTLVVGRYVPDWIYDAARQYFEDPELTILAVTAASISGRYRPETCFWASPGTSEPPPLVVAGRSRSCRSSPYPSSGTCQTGR